MLKILGGYHRKCVENVRGATIENVLKINSPPPENRAVWDNVEIYGMAGQATDDSITRSMRVACWIPKTTNTHSECNTSCFPTASVIIRTHLSVTSCVRCLSCSGYVHHITSDVTVPVLGKVFELWERGFISAMISDVVEVSDIRRRKFTAR